MVLVALILTNPDGTGRKFQPAGHSDSRGGGTDASRHRVVRNVGGSLAVSIWGVSFCREPTKW